jgi:Rrf2 family protein
MKISAQEEYGLRCALQLARIGPEESLTIPEIAEREGLSVPYVAKILAQLRQAEVVVSVRGRTGGYSLARPADRLPVSAVLRAMGFQPWDEAGCNRFPGPAGVCIHSSVCAIRTLWCALDNMVERFLEKTTLEDLLRGRVDDGTQAEAGRTALAALES